MINQGMDPTENNGHAHTGQMLHNHISATINHGIEPTETMVVLIQVKCYIIT